MKYDAIKTSQLLSDALLFKENKDGGRFNIAKACSRMGISRKRFYDLLNGKSHEPTISVLAKVIQYFKEEGYLLGYTDFLELDEKQEEHIVIPINVLNIDENTLHILMCRVKANSSIDHLIAYRIEDSPYNVLSKDEIVIVNPNYKDSGNYLACSKGKFHIVTKFDNNYIDIFTKERIICDKSSIKGGVVDVVFD